MNFTLPIRFQYLTETKKIFFKGYNLRTIYLIHLIDYIIKEFTIDEMTFQLYSVVMKSLYGKHYSVYVDYLIDTGFIQKISNYSTLKHQSTQYKLIDNLSEVIIHKGIDYILQKKLSKYYSSIDPLTTKSPIPFEIRQKLIDDLYSITINFGQSILFIDKYVKDNPGRYVKNLSMINKIKNQEIFIHFDPYGRFHTNFTNLKSEIRNTFLKIDNEPVGYLDVKTSQPFFLCQILKKDPLVSTNEEVQRFIPLVEEQDIYLYLLNRYPELLKDRVHSKTMVLMTLFDRKNKYTKYKSIFKNEFPFIYDFIEDYEKIHGEPLWKSLQMMESQFIFTNVYSSIINQFPSIKLFTVHDSIYYPKKFHGDIQKIWDKKWTELITYY